MPDFAGRMSGKTTPRIPAFFFLPPPSTPPSPPPPVERKDGEDHAQAQAGLATKSKRPPHPMSTPQTGEIQFSTEPCHRHPSPSASHLFSPVSNPRLSSPVLENVLLCTSATIPPNAESLRVSAYGNHTRSPRPWPELLQVALGCELAACLLACLLARLFPLSVCYPDPGEPGVSRVFWIEHMDNQPSGPRDRQGATRWEP